tara:strand:+ start:41 stop:454 length:414 start_codon:yes stop_codon:yes gene_type:complete
MCWIDLPKGSVGRMAGIKFPGEETPDVVAIVKTLAPRLNDLSDNARRQRGVEGEGAAPITALPHLTAHVRVAREINVSDEDFALPWLGHRSVPKVEAIGCYGAVRPLDEENLAIIHFFLHNSDGVVAWRVRADTMKQ